MRKAVIDLGTNTFHLLIADVGDDGALVEVYRERHFVKLGAEGVDTIGQAPFTRGLTTLRHFREVLNKYAVDRLQAIGTAALRTASNGQAFVAAALAEAQIPIQLISGDEEARLITKGVLRAIPPLQDRILIMDIGGGSTEYIIADQAGVHWQQSFPVGVSVLYKAFHRSDPMGLTEMAELEAHLEQVLAPLAATLQKYPTHHLVGAAGTFDVLAEVLRDPSAPDHPTSHALTLADFPALFTQITKASLAERLAMEGVPDVRADMIVVAMLLLRYTFQLAGINQVTVSAYALKEGAILVR
ncbi:MAG: exopolyphosphatase [Bacteroidota bacterium]